MIDDLIDLIMRRGDGLYGNEPITQTAHALQCASLASEEGASDALIVAALAHDVGHLIAGHGTDFGQRVDDRHEEIGARWLARGFGPDVSEPVRLHVEAKRFLARDPAYRAGLSLGSVNSLALQGGAFDDEAAERFMQRPWAADALRLRRWDDLAKDPHATPPPIERWVPLMRALLG